MKKNIYQLMKTPSVSSKSFGSTLKSAKAEGQLPWVSSSGQGAGSMTHPPLSSQGLQCIPLAFGIKTKTFNVEITTELPAEARMEGSPQHLRL